MVSPQQASAALRNSGLGPFTHFVLFDKPGPWHPACVSARSDQDAFRLMLGSFPLHGWTLYADGIAPRQVIVYTPAM